MGKWYIRRLEDIIDVNPPVKLSKEKAYAFIDIDKVSPESRTVNNAEMKIYTGQSCSKFCSGDTVFSRITPCLENRKIAKVRINGDAGFGSTEFFVFRAKKGLAEENFVYYLTSSDAVVLPAINSMTGASGRQRADRRFVQRLKLKLPDLPTQQRIADILSTYDDLIENNNRRITLLEQAAQELYKEWFVNLHFPGYEHTKIVDGVPEGWERKRLTDVFDYVRGKSYTSKELSDTSGVLMVTLKNIQAFGGYNRYAEKRFSGTFKARQTLSAGDVVMGVTDMTNERRLVGHVALVPNLGEATIFSMDLIKLVPKLTDNIFIYSALHYGRISNSISQLANGTNVLHLKPEAISRIDMLIPTGKIVLLYRQYASSYLLRIELLQNQITLLTEARDRMRPKLMSGEIKV